MGRGQKGGKILQIVVFTKRFCPGGHVLLIDESTQSTKSVRAYTQEGYMKVLYERGEISQEEFAEWKARCEKGELPNDD